MTLEDIKTALNTVGVPVTYFEWDCGAPSLPYIVYLETDTDNVFADDRVHIQRAVIGNHATIQTPIKLIF